MPMITDLRNPSLKTRHWETIQNVLEYVISDDEPLTLGRLVDIDGFHNSDAIQEVSSQASSEASLELILKKVGFVSSLTARRVV